MSTPERLAGVLARASEVIPFADAEHEAAVQTAVSREQREARLARLRFAGIELARDVEPLVVANEGLHEGRSLRVARAWLANPLAKPWVLFAGAVGCGKSVAAAWAVASYPHAAFAINALELERVFSASFGEEVKVQQRVYSTPLLVLDDIGTEKNPEEMQLTLYRILESRKRKRTALTANLSEESWRERYPDERLQSRFTESLVVTADSGADLRERLKGLATYHRVG